jgi:cyclopropane-fatty-acyl-phospholipid synthase
MTALDSHVLSQQKSVRSIKARPVATRDTAVDRMARSILFSLLRRVEHCHITIHEQGKQHDFGSDRPDAPHANVYVHSPRVYIDILKRGSVALGQTYIDQWWDADDLDVFLQALARELPRLEPLRHRVNRLTSPVTGPMRRVLHKTNKRRDRQNIHAHYDLGNDFFEQFLDPTMLYSSAYFLDVAVPLRNASEEKIKRICQKLQLSASDHVLEIGSGWGEFACYAAREFGCSVTTTTISSEQENYVRDKVRASGLEHLVTVLGKHYQDVMGTFDAIVSIEMIEAIDWREHDKFFQTCMERLTPNGRMAIQAIVIGDQRYERAKSNEDFIKRFVFPGGCLPSVHAMLSSTKKVTDFAMVDLEDFGHHYAETLRRWRMQLNERRTELADRGYDEVFLRMWNFYLAYCEGGFAERYVSVVHAVFVRPQWRATGLRARSV